MSRHDEDDKILGYAEAKHEDWVGSATMGTSIAFDDTLHQFTGIDPAKWRICGIELGGFNGNDSTWAYVYAVSSDLIGDFDDWAKAAQDNGGNLPVTRFEIRGSGYLKAGMELLALFEAWDLKVTLRDAVHRQAHKLEVIDDVRIDWDAEM